MGRSLRKLLFGALVAIVPLVFLFLGARGYEFFNDMVTTEIVTVRSPIAGIVLANPLRPGLAGDGTTGIEIRDPRNDGRNLDSLTSELAHLLQTIETHQGSIAWFDEQIASEEGRLRATLSGMRLEVQLQQEILRAEVKAKEARVGYLAAQYERAQRLQGSAASQATLDATEADLEETRAQIEGLNVKLEQLDQRADFLEQGLPLSDFSDHAAILSDRIQSMKIERQNEATTVADLEGQLEMLRGRMDSEQRHYDLLSRFAQAPPTSAVVWEVFLGAGATVAEGATVYTYVDCDQRFVQVAIGDATSELLQPGHAVEVSLYGRDELMEGRVVAVFGSAAKVLERRTLAAQLEETGSDEAIALIALPPADDASRQYRLCDIGRTAYVRFEGIGILDPLLNRLW